MSIDLSSAGQAGGDEQLAWQHVLFVTNGVAKEALLPAHFCPPQPSHPLQRYCSQACQEAARQWRRWQAARRYRATPHGQQQRQAQSRRYRARQRARPATALAEPSVAEPEQREGQRDADFLADFSARPCQRPGCYELFVAEPHEPPQRFCCSACRRALRRVLEREARWRRRHHGSGAGCCRPPPRC